jgi:hypothetical protein
VDYTKLYRLIGIYAGACNELAANDTCGNGYLHMHALDNKLLENTKWVETEGKAGVLYQWGDIKQKSSTSRYVTVSDEQRSLIGCLGIGAVAIGNEANNDFYNGGEAFIYGDKAFRVIKGNMAKSISGKDGYWLLQATSFKNSFSSNIIKTAGSRRHLIRQIINLITEDIMFVTTFLARFKKKGHLARSNGILPTDEVKDRSLSCFSAKNAIGGHLIGDSNDIGDTSSLGHKSSSFELIIEGKIEVEAISKIEYFD